MTPQNLLILMADEHNPKMLGCGGHPLVKTPNLDALAARGTRFTDAYTTCPICVPARASFATGRYINDIEYWDNSIAYDGRVQGWGHRLQAAGIPVESIGTLHYRNEADPVGLDRQHVPMHIKDGVGMVQLSIRRQFPDFVPPKRSGGGVIKSAGRGESEYTRYDRRIADIACDWLHQAAARDQRWVLFVSFVTPHYPLVAPDEFLDLYPVDKMPDAKFGAGSGFKAHPWFANFQPPVDGEIEQHRFAFAAYLGLCSFMDAQVGRVLDALRHEGLADTTRIIYTSDHGENAGARGMWGKSNHYQEATGIPLILAGPDVPVGKLCHTPVTLADAHPSILDAAGLPHGNDGTPGRSLFELANSPDDNDRVAFSEYHAAGSPSASYMIRRGRYKYIHYVGYDPELFDLEADPEESANLAQDPKYAAVVDDLDRILRGIVDPEEADRRANQAQRQLIESRGGPEQVMANLVTEKNYTPVPTDIVAETSTS
jgi:choline-sulfatase